MIKLIIDLLAIGDHYGVSKNVDFAKGVKQYPQSYKQGWSNIKRIYKSK
jgi:hypothetical protein